jgi:hypothetical protein
VITDFAIQADSNMEEDLRVGAFAIS